MKISILYEDKDMLVINKPSGLVVHPDGKTKEPSLTDWLVKKYPSIKKVGEPLKLHDGSQIERPGIVHRIDRETSGCLIIAKSPKAHTYLKRQFQKREINKIYHCFVYGKLKEDEGEINKPIKRSINDFRKWTAERGGRGTERDALTYYFVKKRTADFTFVEANPKTGRTHQIRVHFKSIGHPVVCDKLYAPSKNCALGFTRLALHAFSVEFKKLDGKIVLASAPYPRDFKEAVSKI